MAPRPCMGRTTPPTTRHSRPICGSTSTARKRGPPAMPSIRRRSPKPSAFPTSKRSSTFTCSPTGWSSSTQPLHALYRDEEIDEIADRIVAGGRPVPRQRVSPDSPRRASMSEIPSRCCSPSAASAQSGSRSSSVPASRRPERLRGRTPVVRSHSIEQLEHDGEGLVGRMTPDQPRAHRRGGPARLHRHDRCARIRQDPGRDGAARARRRRSSTAARRPIPTISSTSAGRGRGRFHRAVLLQWRRPAVLPDLKKK